MKQNAQALSEYGQTQAVQPALSVRQLVKVLHGRRIVDDLNLTLWPGEVFGLLGPNGAGKTTTIRMLTGLIRPTSGVIHIAGHDLRKQFRAAMQAVGCIVENPDLYSYLSGYDNLLHLARMHGPHAVKRIPEVVEQVGLSARIGDRVRTYSLGMKQRLGIAQALLHEPRVLILDEPTNGLDPAGLLEMRRLVRTLAAQGAAVLISSHLLSEMEHVCDRVALLSGGRVILSDTVAALTMKETAIACWRVSNPLAAQAVIQRHGQLCDATQPTEAANYTVCAHLSDDQAAEVTSELVAAGIAIYALERKQPTLEDVFFSHTRSADTAHSTREGEDPYAIIR